MKLNLRLLFLVLTAPALLSLSACADQEIPTNPSTAPLEATNLSFSTTGERPDLPALATFNTRPSITIAWAKKWIGAEGGRLDFQGFAIEVPAGAVSEVTQFSIHLPVDPHGSERVLARLGPHGAEFAEPLTIEFPLAGTSIAGSEDATVVWWNGTEWVDMGGSAIEDGSRLVTTTDHFSDYGTTDDSLGGGVTASGG